MNENFFVFDMDGLILNSLNKLSNCMLQAIKPYCKTKEDYEIFKAFDLENPGLSRYEKIDFLIKKNDDLNIKSQLKLKEQILKKFDTLSLEARMSSEIDNDIYRLDRYFSPKNLVVLSNCEKLQLKKISANFALDGIFQGGLFGTPPGKKVIYKNIINAINKKSVCLVSDSEADALIAREFETKFCFIRKFARDDAPWLRYDESRFDSISQLIQVWG
jgi:phosphoglycolate phosphatase-like HAD superfamily hydrolase